MYIIALVLVIIAICCREVYIKQTAIDGDKEYTGDIPKVIMQTGPTMESERDGAQEWKTLNPEYKYVFFDNKKCRAFINEHFDPEVLKAFDKLKPGAFKSDLFRYCYLYKEGGVYADLDMAPNVSLNQILLSGYDMITVSDILNVGVFQAFMACVPNISLFLDVIDMIVYYSDNNIYTNDSLCITGPCIWKVLFNLYKSGDNEINGYKIYMYVNKIFKVTIPGYFSIFNRSLISNKGAKFRSDSNRLQYTSLFNNKLLYNADVLFCTWGDNTNTTSYINKKYCDRYGYKFIADHTRRVPEAEPYWERFPLILDLMEKYPYKYIMWIDADACLNPNSQYTIEEIINPNDTKDFIFSADLLSDRLINSGSFIVKNNKYTKQILEYFMTHINIPCNKYTSIDECVITPTYVDNIKNIQLRSVVVPYGTMQCFTKDKYMNKCKNTALIINTSGISLEERKKNLKLR